MFNLQIKGCALGRIYATAYANIFGAEFEQKYILSVNKRQINTFLKLYLWYRYGMDEIRITAEWFYEWTEPKIFLHKIRQQIWLQANRILWHFSLRRLTT